MNLKRGLVSFVIFVVLLLLTGTFAQHTESGKTVLGVVAPTLPPAFLTLYLILLLLFSTTIIDALAAFFMAAVRKTHRESSLWLLPSLVAVLCITVIIVLLIRTSPTTLMSVLITFQEAVAILRNVGNSQLSGRTQMSNQMLFLSYYTFFAFGGIVIISVVLLLTAFHRAVSFSREDANVGYDEVQEKAIEIVGKAVTTLKSGADYQDVIIACYKQMCTLLAVVGLEIQLTQTASEFANQVCQKLRIGKESVRGLTFLFEEARYSHHSVGNDKRSTAISLLASLKHELARVGGQI